MMQADNQHLDFLISQYLDGCLEGTNKKQVEQQMLNDPGARALYNQQQEVQDLLDDWGSRIPLVDWADFDKKLDGRLEKEQRDMERGAAFRRRLRPFAAAAALLLAAGVGYAWHAMAVGHARVGVGGGSGVVAAAGPAAGVEFPDMKPRNIASRHALAVVEPAARGLSNGVARVTLPQPTDSEAVESLYATLTLGMPEAGPATAPRQGSVASEPQINDGQPDEKELR